MSDELTFRDFAGAIMGNDHGRASEVLGVLLGIDAEAARAATTFFVGQMTSNPAFMMKAMGMRTVVTEGSQEELTALMTDCFDLQGDVASAASDAVWARYRS